MRGERAADRPELALADSDERRDADPSWCLRTYLATPDALAPASSDGRERLAWTLRAQPGTERQLIPVWLHGFRALSEHDEHAALARQLGTGAAVVAMSLDDTPLAEAILDDLLPVVRGSGTLQEVVAYLTLATIRADVSRHFEALILARHALGCARGVGASHLAADALVLSAYALAGLGDADAASASLQAAEALGELSEGRDDYRARVRRLDAGACIAHLRKDVATALQCAREVVRLGGATGDAFERDRLLRLAHVQCDGARMADAERTLAKARAIPGEPAPHSRFGLAYESARIAAAGADGDRALTFAHEALRILERDRQAASLRLDAGARLSRLLTSLGRPDAAARALDVHAALLLEQIADMDAAAEALPEIEHAAEADRRVLVQAHARYIEREKDTLTAIARLLGPAIRDGAEWATRLVRADGTTRICAWCSRTESPDGRWLPVGHLVPTDGPVTIRHGMCANCLADARRSPGDRT